MMSGCSVVLIMTSTICSGVNHFDYFIVLSSPFESLESVTAAGGEFSFSIIQIFASLADIIITSLTIGLFLFRLHF